MARDMTNGGYAVVKSFEGRALKSYKDSVGVPTIGYGNTNYDEFAVQYLGGPIKLGMSITEAQAEYLLHESIRRKYAPQVEKKMPGVSDGAFDAGVSFHYNTGAISRASWVQKLVSGAAYRDSLMSWNKAGGKVLAGLTRRRAREYSMAHDNDYGPEGRTPPVTIRTDAHGNENGSVAGTVPAPAPIPAPVPVPPVDHPDHPLAGTPGMLRKGDKGPEVGDLQEKLNEAGFTVKVSEEFDDATDKAVQSFQKAHPQLGHDGVVGPATRTALQREVDMKRKLKTSTASTTVPSTGAVIADQASGGGMPMWFYACLGAVVVGVALYYGWKYRDEIRGWLARKGEKNA